MQNNLTIYQNCSVDFRKETWKGFKEYYRLMMLYGDCDPAYPAMNYVADRLEYNPEQRYWMAFLYGCTYCAPTVYYIMNEFPDYENVDVNRLQRWWEKNKKTLYFQTDRRKVQSFNKFIDIFKGYQHLVGRSQVEALSGNPTYEDIYNWSSNIYYFGRFSIFNYIESLNELTRTKTQPTFFNLAEAKSCRKGLQYALDGQVKEEYETSINYRSVDFEFLQEKLVRLKNELTIENPDLPVNLWNIETVLCAYKKLWLNRRYLGYYIDRQQGEIELMERGINKGVDWSILWDFRREFFHPKLLGELNNRQGIQKDRLNLFSTTGQFLRPNEQIQKVYKPRVKFESIGDIYGG